VVCLLLARSARVLTHWHRDDCAVLSAHQTAAHLIGQWCSSHCHSHTETYFNAGRLFPLGARKGDWCVRLSSRCVCVCVSVSLCAWSFVRRSSRFQKKLDDHKIILMWTQFCCKWRPGAPFGVTQRSVVRACSDGSRASDGPSAHSPCWGRTIRDSVLHLYSAVLSSSPQHCCITLSGSTATEKQVRGLEL